MQLEPAFGGPDDEPIEGKLDRTAGEALARLGRHVNRINGALTRIPGHTNSVSVPYPIMATHPWTQPHQGPDTRSA